MSATRKPITEKTCRISRDAVTGETIRVELDAVQRAYERIHATIDRNMLGLSGVECERLVQRLQELLCGMVKHT